MFSCVFFISLGLLACASPLGPRGTILNATYVSPVFQQSRSNIEEDSLASVHSLLNTPGLPPGWIGQNAFTVAAQWDAEHQTKDFNAQYEKNESYYAIHPGGCTQYHSTPLVDCFNDDAAWAAMASLAGYQAYGNETYLQWAKEVHEFVTNHGFINNTVIQEGYLKGTHFANNTLKATCDGKSMYGGVYFENGSPLATKDEAGAFKAASQTAIDSGSTADYALLSAMLCTLTNDMSYCDRGYDSMQYMDRFFVDPAYGLVNGPIDGKTCARPKHVVSTTNTGNYIAAYSLLSNKTANATALALARQMAVQAMTTDLWNTEQGVFANGTKDKSAPMVAGLKSVLIRGLHLVSPLMDADMQNAILQYVNIQYWSLANYDSDNAAQPLRYGPNWNGPRNFSTSAEVSERSQLGAVDVLNALALNPDSAFPNYSGRDKPVMGL